MSSSSSYLDALVRELARLPGVGAKSASRLAFHILKMDRNDVVRLSKSLVELKDNIRSCSLCGGISDADICHICSDTERDQGIICVVGEARDIITIEKTGEFRGLYHSLNGLISPLDGIGPSDLNIPALLKRCSGGTVNEVILALNQTIEGDATSMYIFGIISPLGIKVTRIARGLPVGADLEFSDSATIAKSIKGRVDF